MLQFFAALLDRQPSHKCANSLGIGSEGKMMARVILVFAFMLFGFSEAASAARIALVIGNQSYDSAIGPLANPHNDIELVGSALKRVNFDVRPLKDASLSKIGAEVEKLARDLAPAEEDGIGFLYYAGHGVADPQTDANYLIPTGVSDLRSTTIWQELLPLNTIIDLLRKHAPKANFIVVFDACRNELNNPPTSMSKSFVVKAPAGPGMLLAFSTAPGRSASDAGRRGGPYATSLARELVEPGWLIEVFRRVGTDVFNKTGQRQVPWLKFDTIARICLAGCEPVVPSNSIRPQHWRMQSIFPGEFGIAENQAKTFWAEIGGISRGKVRFDLLSVGALVQSFQVYDALSAGLLDAAFSYPRDLSFRNPAFLVLSGAIPFGLPPGQFVEWLRAEGSEKLNDLYRKVRVRVHSIPCGLTGPPGLWSSKQIDSASDLLGMRIGATASVAALAEQAGLSRSTSVLAWERISPAIESGAFDAMVSSNPLADIDDGVHRTLASRYSYYYPGWPVPVEMFDLIISSRRWDTLTEHEKFLFNFACRANMERSLKQLALDRRIGLDRFAQEGVAVKTFPDAVMADLKRRSNDRLAAEQNADFQQALASYRRFQQ